MALGSSAWARSTYVGHRSKRKRGGRGGGVVVVNVAVVNVVVDGDVAVVNVAVWNCGGGPHHREPGERPEVARAMVQVGEEDRRRLRQAVSRCAEETEMGWGMGDWRVVVCLGEIAGSHTSRSR